MTVGHLFLSYATPDRDLAEIVRDTLEQHQHSVWMAPRDVPPGMTYPEAIIGAIRGCDSAVLILSANSNHSPHVLREVERACTDGKKLLMIRVEGIDLSDGLAYFANLIQWVEAPREELQREPEKLLRPIMDGTAQSLADEAPSSKREAESPNIPLHDAAATNFSALADAQRKMLTTFGVAVLDFICQRPDPAEPVKRRALLSQLVETAPTVFEGLTYRQFESLLHDAKVNGCIPGLLETRDGVFVLEENISVKLERNAVSKNLIARYAAKLVASGSVVAVDGGSTTLPIVQNLLAGIDSGELEDLVIVTNSLTNAQAVSTYMSDQGWTDDTAMIKLYLSGGYVRPNTHATTWGNWVQRESEELRTELQMSCHGVDIAFVGGNGFDLEPGITMGSDAELGFKRFALESASASYIVADSSKAGITLPVQIAKWDDRFILLTNVLPQEVAARLDELVLSGRVIEVRE